MLEKMLNFENSWNDFLEEESKKEYFTKILNFLEKEYKQKNIFPEIENIFNAFKLTDLTDLKVVILGQDPYHKKYLANGLAFSVNSGLKFPPSLKNIFKEINLEYKQEKNFLNGDLSCWAKQGVLLLNTTLTVEEGKANSHSKIGWQIFTDNVIKYISDENNKIIFILWGNNARTKKSLIDEKKHYILEGVHPSPLSANRGFFHCNHFKKVNEILQNNKKNPIDWYSNL